MGGWIFSAAWYPSSLSACPVFLPTSTSLHGRSINFWLPVLTVIGPSTGDRFVWTASWVSRTCRAGMRRCLLRRKGVFCVETFRRIQAVPQLSTHPVPKLLMIYYFYSKKASCTLFPKWTKRSKTCNILSLSYSKIEDDPFTVWEKRAIFHLCFSQTRRWWSIEMRF